MCDLTGRCLCGEDGLTPHLAQCSVPYGSEGFSSLALCSLTAFYSISSSHLLVTISISILLFILNFLPHVSQAFTLMAPVLVFTLSFPSLLNLPSVNETIKCGKNFFLKVPIVHNKMVNAAVLLLIGLLLTSLFYHQ